MRLLTLFLFLFELATLKAQINAYSASFTRPFGISFDLKLPPLDGPQNKTLYFCTDHSAIDSVWYQYNSMGKLIAYTTFESEYYGFIYKEFRLQYDDKGRLNHWEYLPNATNNGLNYSWTYDSIGNIINLETFITSTQGVIPWERISRVQSSSQYSVYQLVRSDFRTNQSTQILNDFYFLDTLFLVDFHLSGRVDSSYVLANSLSAEPNYIYRYNYQEDSNSSLCTRKLFYKETWYEGQWVVDPFYEGYSWYPTRLNYLPTNMKGAYFIVDSTWQTFTPWRAHYYFYSRKMGQLKLDSLAENRNASLNIRRKWLYNPQGQLASHEAFEIRFWESLDYSYLLNPSDTGGSSALLFNTRHISLNVWSCQTSLNGLEIEGERALVLYPNPSNGPLNITLSDELISDKGQLLLCDSQGRLIVAERVSSKEHGFSLPSLKKGLYYLIYEGPSRRLTKTWVRN